MLGGKRTGESPDREPPPPMDINNISKVTDPLLVLYEISRADF